MKKRVFISVIIMIVLASLSVKAVLIFTANPRVTVDYVAEYNRMTCPANYDPNQNAADEYQKAYDAFVKIPREIQEDPYINWPADFNDDSRQILKEWLDSNKQSFEFFKIASHKTYYWLERGAKGNGEMKSMSFPEMTQFRDLIEAKLWDAKYKAIEGQFKSAFEDIENCILAGNQKCQRPSWPFEMAQGYDTKERTIKTVLCMISRIQFSSEILTELQDVLEVQFKKQSYLPYLETRRLEFYDELQRSFVDNGKGTGRLAWSKAKDFTTLCIDSPNPYLACFLGPARNEMVKRMEEKYSAYNSIINKTPYRVYKEDSNYFDKFESCGDCGNADIFVLFPLPNTRFYHHYYRLKARADASISILAIQRFKADKGILPSKLDELVSNGYLKDLPLDPYSNGTLVYRLNESEFTLYSAGQNFIDDGGKEPNKTTANPSGDIVFWPVKKYDQRIKRIDESKDVNTLSLSNK